MKKLDGKKLTIYLIINIVYILVGSILVTTNIIDKYMYQSVLTTILLFLNIIIIIWLIKNKNVKHKIDILILIILMLSLISSIFAYNVIDALVGAENRYEGLYMIMYYFSLFYISSYVDSKYKKYIVYAMLCTGFVQSICAICQKLNLFNINPKGDLVNRWAKGFVKNPNFLGTYMLICLSYSLGLFIDNNTIKKKVIFLFLVILFLIGLLISNTLSVVVGLFIVLLYILIYTIKIKKIKELIIILITIPLVTFIIHVSNLTRIVSDLNVFKNETKEIVTNANVNKSDYGTGRVYVWKETLKKVPEHLFTGIGIDNFKYINNGLPIIRHVEKEDGIYDYAYDKTHNEYLQMLITGGIFYLISYLIFYFIIVKNGIKNSFKNKEVYLILPVIGYLVQAFFNISVIEVAPLFYIALGLCIIRNKVGDKTCS